MDNLLEQFANISKAHAYDVIKVQRDELLNENQLLKDRVKYLENLIKEYSDKMLSNISDQ